MSRRGHGLDTSTPAACLTFLSPWTVLPGVVFRNRAKTSLPARPPQCHSLKGKSLLRGFDLEPGSLMPRLARLTQWRGPPARCLFAWQHASPPLKSLVFYAPRCARWPRRCSRTRTGTPSWQRMAPQSCVRLSNGTPKVNTCPTPVCHMHPCAGTHAAGLVRGSELKAHGLG